MTSPKYEEALAWVERNKDNPLACDHKLMLDALAAEVRRYQAQAPARVKELREELTQALQDGLSWKLKAEAAEARVVELEAESRLRLGGFKAVESCLTAEKAKNKELEAALSAARVIMTAIPVDALHVACVERDELRTKLEQTTEALSVEVNRRMTAESELAELRAKNRDLNIAADWSHENERLLAANITLRAERDALREAVERAKAEAFGEVLERAQIEVNACRHHAQVSKGANKRLHEAAQGVAQVIVYYCQNRLRSLHAAPAASPRRGRSLD